MLYVVSANYDKKLNSIYLQLYDDEKHRLIKWFDKDYKAYCLTSMEDLPITTVKKTTVTRQNLLQNKTMQLYKIETDNPSEIIKTHQFDKVWENHIKFHMNYLYDKNIDMGMPYELNNGLLKRVYDDETELKINEIQRLFAANDTIHQLISYFEYSTPKIKRAAVDIEVINQNNDLPNPEIANFPVLCIAIYSPEENVVYAMSGAKTFENVKYKIIFYNDEKKMLMDALRFMQKFPFIITFNGDGFDLMYICNRLIRLGVPEEEIPISQKGLSLTLHNCIHLDIYRFFSINAIKNYAFQGKYKDIDLNTLSKLFLNKEKLKKEKNMFEMSLNDIIEYCMQDAILTYELTCFENELILSLMLIISRISKLPIEEVCRKSIGKWIESFLFYFHRKNGYLIPNPSEIKTKGTTITKSIIKGKKYKGAIVLDPVDGIFFDVKVIDYGSLYPSIIKEFNIGYETINCNCGPECEKNKYGDLPHWICKNHKSLESLFIGYLKDLRLKWYKKQAKNDNNGFEKWYKAVEQTIKVFMNAAYGIFASDENFVFYCPIVSEEIAGIARSIILKTVEKAKELEIKILYGDTDSIFVIGDKAKIEQLQKWAADTFQIDLELDKEYIFVCLSERKKNYLGLQTKGVIDVKGLTGKKSHTPLFYKNLFDNVKQILKSVKTEEDLNSAKMKVRELVFEAYKKLKKKQWNSLDELTFHVNIHKRLTDYGKVSRYTKEGKPFKQVIPQHIKVAKMLEASGVTLREGQKVAYIKAKNDDGVLPLLLAKNDDVDVEKYIEFLRTTCEQFLEPLDLEFNEIIGFKKLDTYFG